MDMEMAVLELMTRSTSINQRLYGILIFGIIYNHIMNASLLFYTMQMLLCEVSNTPVQEALK